MGSGKLFHKERPMYDKVFCCVSLVKRVLKPSKIISCVYSTVQSKFKVFLQIKRTAVFDKLESYSIDALQISFVARLPISRSKLRERCILSNRSQNRVHLFCTISVFFFDFGIWVQSWAHVVKTWLSQHIAKNSTKFTSWNIFFFASHIQATNTFKLTCEMTRMNILLCFRQTSHIYFQSLYEVFFQFLQHLYIGT